MTEFITQNFVPLLFGGLFVFLLTGIPVAFGLAATGLLFGFIGMEVGLFPTSLFQALPQRVFGIMQNDTLLAIPFFTFMGIILERSGMAEDLLETVGQVFGPLRGGLAVAVILVGALLAATTGVVAAAVISHGPDLAAHHAALRLQPHHRHRHHHRHPARWRRPSRRQPGADRAGRPDGPLGGRHVRRRHGAGPAAGGLYLAFVAVVAFVKPKWVPALPQEARIYREANGARAMCRCWCCWPCAAAPAYAWSQVHDSLFKAWLGRTNPSPGDEVLIMSMTVASLLALGLAIVNSVTRMGLLSKLAEQVTFVLIPPLVLIFLVLGTIFLGVATPTEGGAMGALGALIMAMGRRKLSGALMHQALDSTAKLATFVLFILIGSTVFSFTFNAADGHIWVEHLFDKTCLAARWAS
jgi:TRAP-type mannitol/chloroaromatic compound transport system permease large subunit